MIEPCHIISEKARKHISKTSKQAPRSELAQQKTALQQLSNTVRALQLSLKFGEKIWSRQGMEIAALKSKLAAETGLSEKIKRTQANQAEKLAAFESLLAQEQHKSAQQAREIEELRRKQELLVANLNTKGEALLQLDTQHGSLDNKCTGLREDVDKLDMRSHRQENDLHHVSCCLEGEF